MFEDIVSKIRSESSSYEKVSDNSTVRISVVGVGGAGCNCVTRLVNGGIRSARTVAINTDSLHLEKVTKADRKVLIGSRITKGMGAGGNPDVAKKCAEVDRELLRREIGENELVFLVAGMGGGTGTGVSPIVAEIAKELGSVVIAIVTYPFALERVRIKKAQQGIEELKKHADTVVVIDNNRLVEYVPNLPMDKAFEFADSVAGMAVRGISDTIMFPSLINLDFADVRSIMKDGGIAFISLGEGSGYQKVDQVVENTLKHPLLDVDYEGAKGALVHIEGGPDLTLAEAYKIWEGITASFDEDANIKVGARINPQFREKVRTTAIVVGVRSPMIFQKEEKNENDFLLDVM